MSDYPLIRLPDGRLQLRVPVPGEGHAITVDLPIEPRRAETLVQRAWTPGLDTVLKQLRGLQGDADGWRILVRKVSLSVLHNGSFMLSIRLQNHSRSTWHERRLFKRQCKNLAKMLKEVSDMGIRGLWAKASDKPYRRIARRRKMG